MEKVTNKGKLLAIKGTTKAAVLVGDPGCPHLVVVTVYDNVPVRFITTAHETIEWTQQWRKAYNRTLQMEARAPPPTPLSAPSLTRVTRHPKCYCLCPWYCRRKFRSSGST